MKHKLLIDKYLEKLKTTNFVYLDDFLFENGYGENLQMAEEIYREIYASDYYNLLFDKIEKSKDGVYPRFELSPTAANALSKYKTLQEFIEQKNKEKHNTTSSKSLFVQGDFIIKDNSKVNLFSDNSNISSSDEVLNQLENMIELIRHNSNMDNILKAKLIDMNEELQAILSQSDKSKLPMFDNIVSLAANFASLYGLIK